MEEKKEVSTDVLLEKIDGLDKKVDKIQSGVDRINGTVRSEQIARAAMERGCATTCKDNSDKFKNLFAFKDGIGKYLGAVSAVSATMGAIFGGVVVALIMRSIQ